MVQLTQLLMIRVSQIARKRFRGTYLDKVHVAIHAGNGGAGNQKFGGIGGKGGDVYMQATIEANDLRRVVRMFPDKRIKAGHGRASTAKLLLGQRGDDVTVRVPCGVRAITNDKLIIGEVNKADEKVILARGGVGGGPATGFSGVRGQRLAVTFELSLIADVSLLGFPNAGKSTLLRACSNATPTVAAYPFTTIKPNVGIVQYEDFRALSMADLPGLIEGAHANFGMGHKFLRHIERSKLILMIVDAHGFQLSMGHPNRSAIETIALLNKELELYDPSYLEKPMALLINKMDRPGSDKIFADVKDKLKNLEEFSKELPENMKSEKWIQFEEIIPISAKEKEGVQLVKDYMRASLARLAEKEMSSIQGDVNELTASARERGPYLL